MFDLYLAISFVLLIFLILLTFYLISLLISFFFGSPYLPTEEKIVDQILSLANLKRNKLFIELGCGDGRVVKRAATKFLVKGIGIDINPYLITYLKAVNKLKKINNPQFVYQNFFKTKLSKADYIYCFLMPKVLEKLKDKLNRELKKNTLVISHGFPVPNWEKKLIKTLKNKKFSTYYYRY